MDIVKSRVKPTRQKLKDKGYREKWWKFGRRAVALYKTIHGLHKVIFHSFTSKYTAFGFVPSNIIFAAPHVVIASDDYGCFAVLQSSIHECWVREYTSYSLSLARYTPSVCFETFPFLANTNELSEIGQKYYSYRQQVMEGNGVGLTDIYNMANDQENHEASIIKLRDISIELDCSVVKSYGWSDIELEHDFYETKDGLRFTISSVARNKLLQKLLMLNHERHNYEVSQEFYKKKIKKPTIEKINGKKAKVIHQQSFLDESE